MTSEGREYKTVQCEGDADIFVNKKEKFLKKIKNTIPVNTQVTRKWNSLIANMEKVLAGQIEDQTSHNVSLGLSRSSAQVPLIMWMLTEVQRL